MSLPAEPAAWLFDIGNSRLKVAHLDGAGDVQAPMVFDHAEVATDQTAQRLPSGEVAYVSNVAPDAIAGPWMQLLTARFGRICMARSERQLGALVIAYPHPQRLGVDRFLAMLAVHAQVHQDALLVGVGTALTIDLLRADGVHQGGLIAPSPTLMREALHAKVPQLPRTGGNQMPFADDTADALASGCDGAAVSLVEQALQDAGQQLGQPPALVVHGGGVDALLRRLPQARHLPNLVLGGLAQWAQLTGGNRR